ncbi:MAG: CDP-alcohol phosphatidyltransferase family protein [Candidatus Nanopelagicales bacterium]|nr:CDP-alcohol phosphatidyltransferase family protein [Candidatus Nanopelagicales bacterium]
MTTLLVPAGASAEEMLRDTARKLRVAGGPVALVASDLVIAPAALAPITADPFAGTALLVQEVPGSGDVRVRHHLVNSVGSSHHRVTAPDHQFIGALAVAAADAQVVAQAIEAMADAAATGGLGDPAHLAMDPVQLVAVAMVRSGVSCRAIELVDVPWFRGSIDFAAAERAVATVSDERIAQLQANRIDDGFYSTFVVRRLSKPLTRLAIRTGLSPNLITVISLVVGLGAAAGFALGYRWPVVIGAVLLQVSLVIDCVDGEVARATRKFSALGAWLDASTDRVKEYLAYAGLAAGAMVLGSDMWPVALILMVLQTTRHMTDYDFSRVQRMREAKVEPRDVADPDDGASGGAGGWSPGDRSISGAMELSTRLNRRSAIRWFKRAIHLPIGERWLIISVVAALFGPKWALLVLLVAVLLALAYVTTGRLLRTMTWQGKAPVAAGLLLGRQFDGGPVIAIFKVILPTATRERIWLAPSVWAIPALIRLFELGLVTALVLVWQPTLVVFAFWWVAVVTFHHYDVLYRALQGYATPRWLTWLGLGWDGRTILVLVAFFLGVSIFGSTLGIGAGVGALLFVVVASGHWLVTQNRATSTRKDAAK